MMQSSALGEVLHKFSEVLYRRNPMNVVLSSTSEYEQEALSILSRFVESALQIADDEQGVLMVSMNIVKQTFEFWFETSENVDVESIARELTTIYLSTFKENNTENDNVK